MRNPTHNGKLYLVKVYSGTRSFAPADEVPYKIYPYCTPGPAKQLLSHPWHRGYRKELLEYDCETNTLIVLKTVDK